MSTGKGTSASAGTRSEGTKSAGAGTGAADGDAGGCGAGACARGSRAPAMVAASSVAARRIRPSTPMIRLLHITRYTESDIGASVPSVIPTGQAQLTHGGLEEARAPDDVELPRLRSLGVDLAAHRGGVDGIQVAR